MARRNDSWGIEVGANAIKALRLVRHGKNAELAEWDILPFKQVLTTPDVNVDEAIQVNLDAFMAKHDLSKSNVVVSVPGHLAFARFAKLPPVEPKKIPDIVRFEAVQQIPFPIDQVEWDYQVFQQPDSPDVEVGIFAITKERVANFLSNYRQVNLRIDALTLSPLAVYNAFAYDSTGDDKAAGTIYMDIGTASTDVIIVEDGGIWLRTLPIGGNNFTDALVKSFKLSFAKAEKLKREAGTSKYARQIFQAMRPVFADLVQELQRTLGFYQSMNRDAELTRLVGVGSTFRLPGLQKFLKQQLQMEVVRPDGFKRIHAEDKLQSEFADNALNLATAYGLALQGLELESVTANVLPQSILRARLWKSKQPWIAAAAACVALASGLAGARYFMDQRTYDASFAQNDTRIQTVLRRAQGYVNNWQEIAEGNDPRLRIENLRRILDYRDVWPKLLEDLSLASKTFDPQAPTLTSNFQEIAQIPARQRRRLYIESVRATYLSEPAAPAATPGAAAQPVAMTDGLTTQLAADAAFAEGTTPPRFEITLVGTTPHEDAVRLVSNRFIAFLKSRAKQQNRPYEIVIEGNPIVKQWQVRSTVTPGQQTPGYGPGRPLPGMGGVPGMPGMGGMPWNEGPGAWNGGGQADTASLLPLRPINDEKSQGATGFEIRWTIHLVRPEEARKAEDRRPTRDAAPVPTAAPAEGQPPADAPPAETEAPAPPAAQADPNPSRLAAAEGRTAEEARR